MKRALADSLSLDGTDVPWTVGTARPPLEDIRVGVEQLEAQLQPASKKVAGFCFKKLLAVLEPNTKLNKEEGAARFENWFIAVKDIPDDLWPGATVACMQTLKFFPKPVEFRSHVEAAMRERHKLLRRAREMLAKATEKPKPAPYERPSQDVILRDLRESWKKVGNWRRALSAERDLAKLEGREPDPELVAAAQETPEIVAAATEVAKIPPIGPVLQASLNRSLARTWRKQGFPKRADELEAEADRLDPPKLPTVAPAAEIRGTDHEHLA